MKKYRRKFLKHSAAIAIGLSAFPLIKCAAPEKKLNILILGGTNFLGPAIVKAGLGAGHKISLFNRGRTNPELFPTLQLIKGDRENGKVAYEPLQKKKWDAVIDVWPEKSRLVDEASAVLGRNAGHYVYISSIAVYKNFQEVGLHEKSDVVGLPVDKSEWYYPEEKLAAEKLVAERFPDNHTILRPGAIKGWRDPALDLLYWLIKLKTQENILAPGSGKDPLQFVNVNDVARFVWWAVENKLNGIFNCMGPEKEALLWEEFLNEAKTHLDSTSELIWANEEFLREKKVRSFEDMPLWAPLSEDRGFMQISQEKMLATGFQHTPMEKTMDDCLSWFESNYNSPINFGSEKYPLGLDREREEELMNLYRK